jgi:2-dehydro-3-deoxy-D-arabinonate dehydratase
MLKICRFRNQSGAVHAGLLFENGVLDLEPHHIHSVTELLEGGQEMLAKLTALEGARISLDSVELLAPVDSQEVWAAGVTYLRSKKARMEESEFSASAYDKVYDAPRPEIFFKALAHKVSGPGEPVGIRKDAKWNVPEPELALVLNSKRKLVGFTVGNDMSSRDIEGENLLYLPQAKTYKRSCALGPCITLGSNEAEVRKWTIEIQIERANQTVFTGSTSVNQIKRSFDELIDYLWRSQDFPSGVVLLTGTGIVPGDDFTLAPGDTVKIDISGVGTLRNKVVEV